ncbi:Phosphatidylglycerol/phosphatidylinositol transfer protein [Schizosaccharomyces pombe]|uniref:Phosphatidylglycerol/phosphatidylinositol transfer protein n=1 Tax=Schizosaccharomyces pombe (strain 972 / ATCC 24843) TaxID=284812 RepID=NPC2_SCHPO|nr:phosphatidylglycerol/phosphatidylinositol transfer protein [Schizosaccharomyces pombe]Q9C0X9.1 RecName: Full=Phosphatidylglycerol/phosphatidylinositol transfer protein; Short=PG/PI-TP; Flags: Precursor [Schizosaccharomyces pombe 972h-]CAC37423.1 Niemann-Pick disease type C2 protein hE1 homolog (predicted) [Schizosaccharomyces pombe]|eukprot:NP_594778.1 phosphatidylglycerol/phosphatidylinositol transfer protein [Schizosaccharomyces pombe]
MRLTTFIYAITCLPIFISASSWFSSFSFGESKSTDLVSSTSEKIPGANPASYCADWDRGDDHVVVDYINLIPNPPAAGKNLTIETEINVGTTVLNGSYVDIQVKYGFVRIVNERLDICDKAYELAAVECPVEPGIITKQATISLPWAIPPGRYHVLATAYNADGEQLTCVSASVSFSHFGFQLINQDH